MAISRRPCAAVALLLMAPGTATADILHVPSQYSTIQLAIDAAMDGDEIRVAPGTYSPIDLLGKEVHLRSTDGPDQTVIDAQGAGRVVLCVSGETSATVVDGFTITGGFMPSQLGGGMLVAGSDPTILNCVFRDNSAGIGGGLYSMQSSPTLTDCVFEFNHAITQGHGGAAGIETGVVTLTRCTFQGNTAEDEGGALINYTDMTLIDCTFDDSFSPSPGGAIYNSRFGRLEVTGSTFRRNAASSGGAIALHPEADFLALTDSYFCGNTPDDILGAWTDNGGNEFDVQCECALVVQPSVTCLWPPNHRYTDVLLDVSGTDCTGFGLHIVVTSNEPDDAQGGGDGQTTADIVIVDGVTGNDTTSGGCGESNATASADFEAGDYLRLRAERSGSGVGREYTVTVVATDGLGNSTQSSVCVRVPHDQMPHLETCTDP